ncbi:hypothetical protein D3C73_949950 [compost metagenome]
MPANRFAGFASTARHDVEHACRDPGLVRQFDHAQGAEGSLARRLDHDGATGRQRRGNLPGQHQQREVPRQHQADDADGFAYDHGHGSGPGGGGVVVDLVDQLGVPADGVDGFRHIDVLALADRFAAVQAFQHGQFMGVLLKQAGKIQQDVLALARRQVGPAAIFKGLFRGCHGQVDILHVAGGHVGQLLPGGRIRGDEGLARDRIAEFTIDERLGARFQLVGQRSVLFLAQQFSHFRHLL